MIKRLILLALLAFGLVGPVDAAGLYPLSRMQQFDSNGKLMPGARLFLFNGGTTQPRTGFKDSALTSAHPNPIVADSAGRLPLIYLDTGFYRQRLTTKTGTLIFDDDGIPVLTTASGGSGTSVDPDSVYKTRDIKVRFDDQPLAGYVRLNGRSIGSASSGATERANADTQSLYEELWSFANISVASGKGATAAADFAANKALTLPDAAGKGLFGMDDLGAGAKSRITSATITGPTAPGATGGTETVTISQTQLPSYSLTGGAGSVSASGVSGTQSQGHTHTYSGTSSGQSADHSHNSTFGDKNGGGNVIGGGGLTQDVVSVTRSSGGTSNDHTHTYSGTTNQEAQTHTHTVSVTGTATGVSILSGGSGAALPNMPPALLLMIYIRL
jgi:hypothetical protein